MLRYLIIPRHLLSVVLALLLLLSAGLAAADSYRHSSDGRVVAVGDIHGAFDEFVAVLRGTGLVDAELSWTGGTTHLVSVGDLLHRGDYGRQVIDLVMRLQREAAEAGGAVHVILGNHEVMSLTGDLRYVSAGDYAQFGSEAPPGLPADRLAALRTAFNATMKDSDFLADAKKMGLEVSPITGEQLSQLLDKLYKTPAPVIERARAAIDEGRKAAKK